jgi:hypothetical protein
MKSKYRQNPLPTGKPAPVLVGEFLRVKAPLEQFSSKFGYQTNAKEVPLSRGELVQILAVKSEAYFQPAIGEMVHRQTHTYRLECGKVVVFVHEATVAAMLYWYMERVPFVEAVKYLRRRVEAAGGSRRIIFPAILWFLFCKIALAFYSKYGTVVGPGVGLEEKGPKRKLDDHAKPW